MKRFVTGFQVWDLHDDFKPVIKPDFRIDIEKMTRETSVTLPKHLQIENFNQYDHVVITTKTIEDAKKVLSHLIDINSVLSFGDGQIDDINNFLKEDILPEIAFSNGSILDSIEVFSKISNNNDYLYAFSLLSYSFKLHSNLVVDIDPQYFPYEQHSILFSDHVRFAYAIVMAYESIFQIEIAPEGDFIREGKWIERKKEDFLIKLKSKKINGLEDFIWLVRGEETALERDYLKGERKPAEWADKIVRDCYIPVISALIYARYLRSKIFLHKINNLAQYCSIHEVWNVQQLARLLLKKVAQ